MAQEVRPGVHPLREGAIADQSLRCSDTEKYVRDTVDPVDFERLWHPVTVVQV
jgi:hypothetical protein